MTPSIDDRLASVVRALTEVILPHLPPEASLAQEQAHLCVGHLQIIRAQLDAAPAFEREELDDAIALGRALADGTAASPAIADLNTAITAADGSEPRNQAQAIRNAIDGLLSEGSVLPHTAATILEHEHRRAQKDRHWFAAFGFDTL